MVCVVSCSLLFFVALVLCLIIASNQRSAVRNLNVLQCDRSNAMQLPPRYHLMSSIISTLSIQHVIRSFLFCVYHNTNKINLYTAAMAIINSLWWATYTFAAPLPNGRNFQDKLVSAAFSARKVI